MLATMQKITISLVNIDQHKTKKNWLVTFITVNMMVKTAFPEKGNTFVACFLLLLFSAFFCLFVFVFVLLLLRFSLF